MCGVSDSETAGELLCAALEEVVIFMDTLLD